MFYKVYRGFYGFSKEEEVRIYHTKEDAMRFFENTSINLYQSYIKAHDPRKANSRAYKAITCIDEEGNEELIDEVLADRKYRN